MTLLRAAPPVSSCAWVQETEQIDVIVYGRVETCQILIKTSKISPILIIFFIFITIGEAGIRMGYMLCLFYNLFWREDLSALEPSKYRLQLW